MKFLKSKVKFKEIGYNTYEILDLIYNTETIRHIYKMEVESLGVIWKLIKRDIIRY